MLRVSSKTSLIAAQISSFVDADDLVDRLLRQREGQCRHLADGDTIGEDPDTVERHAPCRRASDRYIASAS